MKIEWLMLFVVLFGFAMLAVIMLLGIERLARQELTLKTPPMVCAFLNRETFMCVPKPPDEPVQEAKN